MEDTVLAILGQDSSGDVVRGIGLNDGIAVEVEVSEDGYRGKPSLKLLEGELLVLIPIEALVLPGKLREQSYCRGEAMDISPVEVGKPQE